MKRIQLYTVLSLSGMTTIITEIDEGIRTRCLNRVRDPVGRITNGAGNVIYVDLQHELGILILGDTPFHS